MSVPRSRISELLELNVLEKEPMFIRMRIFKAMEQYGAEQYHKGRIDQEKVENFKLGLQSDELIRLRELVQAQKELIDLHDKLAESDFLTKKEWMRIDVLRNKIKELDQ